MLDDRLDWLIMMTCEADIVDRNLWKSYTQTLRNKKSREELVRLVCVCASAKASFQCQMLSFAIENPN